MSLQEVNISIPLELYGYKYECGECGAENHISKSNPHPEGPQTTYRACGVCKTMAKLTWYHPPK